MTDLEKYKAKLEEWKKVREAATQGEWVQEKYSADGTNDPMPNVYCNGSHLAGLTYFSRTPEENCLNAKFIALSANNWTKLIEDLKAAIEALEQIANDKEESSHERAESALWASQSILKKITKRSEL